MDLDLDQIKMAVMEALDKALGEQMGGDMRSRMGGGGMEGGMGDVGGMPPPDDLGGQGGAGPGSMGSPGMAGMEGPPADVPAPGGDGLEETPGDDDMAPSRAGWRPWMKRAPGA